MFFVPFVCKGKYKPCARCVTSVVFPLFPFCCFTMAMIVTNEGWMVRPVGGGTISAMKTVGSSAKDWACDLLRKMRILEETGQKYSLEQFFQEYSIGGYGTWNELLSYVVITAVSQAVKTYGDYDKCLETQYANLMISDEKHETYCRGFDLLWLEKFTNLYRGYDCEILDKCRSIVRNDKAFIKKVDSTFKWPILLKFIIKALKMICDRPENTLQGEDFLDEESSGDETSDDESTPSVTVLETVPATTDDFPYKIEKIVDTKTVNRRKQYLIKWENYNDSNNQWMSYEELKNSLQNPSDAKKLIREYNSRRQNS